MRAGTVFGCVVGINVYGQANSRPAGAKIAKVYLYPGSKHYRHPQKCFT